MRVDNDIRHNSIFIEGHILLWHNHADDTLLCRPRAELVSQLGLSDLPETNLACFVIAVIKEHEHLVNDPADCFICNDTTVRVAILLDLGIKDIQIGFFVNVF